MPEVRRLHFVCVADRHAIDRVDGRFSTGCWKVGTDSARSAETLALHPARAALSTRQGRIVERRRVDCEGGKRYVFVVMPDPLPVAWEGAGSGEKGCGY